MTTRLYLLLCNHCKYKKLTDGSDVAFLTEVKTCKDCGGSRTFKCPKCGYLLRTTKAPISLMDAGRKGLVDLRQQEEEKKNERDKAKQDQIKNNRRMDDDEPKFPAT